MQHFLVLMNLQIMPEITQLLASQRPTFTTECHLFSAAITEQSDNFVLFAAKALVDDLIFS